jgi:uncharacterized protein YjiS (DUF1127 family)
MNTSIRTPVGHPASSHRNVWHWTHGLWHRWHLLLRTRAELREMDARALADIGIDRETARRELRKFFWQG